MEEARQLELLSLERHVELTSLKEASQELGAPPPNPAIITRENVLEIVIPQIAPHVQKGLQEALKALYRGLGRALGAQEKALVAKAWAGFQPANQLGLMMRYCLKEEQANGV